MAINPQTTTLLNLDYNTFTELVISLEMNQGWRKVAEFVKIFDQNEIIALSLTTRPAESLLNKLGTKLWSLNDFINILKECSLYDALLVIAKPEPMQIILQPTRVLNGKHKLSVNIGNPFELEFGVTGIPPPKFQWFKDDQILEDQTHSTLRYERYKPEMEGEYFCNATQDRNVGVIEQLYSDRIKIETLPFCELIEKPDECVYFHEGSAIVLTLKVIGYPKPDFEWLHENKVLENENKNVLFVSTY